jgi:aminoglycoside 3-N-acetyltransferase
MVRFMGCLIEESLADPRAADRDVAAVRAAIHAGRIGKEAAAIAASGAPRTRSSLAADLRAGGLRPGMHVLVHTRLSALGWVAGGPVAVIQALQDALTSEGTILMPAFSGDLSDPAHWSRPPVPADWWATIRREMPPFDPLITPTHALGRVPELFRTWPGVRRSNHPHVSFSAWGREAHRLTADHRLTDDLGDESPLGRLYLLDGWTLFLGTDFWTCTAFHLSEHRAGRCQSQRQGAPVMTPFGPQWQEWDSLAYDDEDFPAIGAAYLEEATESDVRRFKVGSADALLMRLRPLVDFATDWMRSRIG